MILGRSGNEVMTSNPYLGVSCSNSAVHIVVLLAVEEKLN